MANRDESHLFSLAALTTRAPAPFPGPRTTDDEEGSVAFNAVPDAAASTLGAGFSVFPLGAPLGSHEPLSLAPQPETGHPLRSASRRTLALVGLASLLGAAIVLVAVWSSRSPEPPATLARPEILTNTLVPPPADPQSSLAVAAAPDPAPPATEPAAEGPSLPENQSGSRTAQPSPRPRARSNPKGNPALSRPAPVRTPAPARGPCAHCSPNDLACNIKCRAK